MSSCGYCLLRNVAVVCQIYADGDFESSPLAPCYFSPVGCDLLGTTASSDTTTKVEPVIAHWSGQTNLRK